MADTKACFDSVIKDDFVPDENPKSPLVPRSWYTQADVSARNQVSNQRDSLHVNVFIQCTSCHQLSQVYEFKNWQRIPCPRCNRGLLNPFTDSGLEKFPSASEILLNQTITTAFDIGSDAKQVGATVPISTLIPPQATTILQHMKESSVKSHVNVDERKKDAKKNSCPECAADFDDAYGPVCRKCDLVPFSCYCCRTGIHQPKSVMCFTCTETAKRLSTSARAARSSDVNTSG